MKKGKGGGKINGRIERRDKGLGVVKEEMWREDERKGEANGAGGEDI